MFDNKKNINFSIFEKNNSTYVQMSKETPLGNSEKTILLQDFLKFITDFNSDKTLTDTGFVVPNLIRKIVKGTRELCFYYFPEITVSPYCNSENLGSTRRISSLFNNENYDFKLGLETSSYDRRGDRRSYERLSVEGLKMKNVMLVTFYDTANNGSLISYNIFHTLNRESIFEDSTTNYINDNTVLFPSIMPNHYSDKICWGSTGFEENLRNYFNTSNFEGIKSTPYIYFNSLFNDDLLSSTYENLHHYKITNEVFTDIVNYYFTKTPGLTINLVEFTSNLRQILLEERQSSGNFLRIKSTIACLMLVIGPIFSDPTLYKKYFTSILSFVDNSNSDSRYKIHTMSSYINSRLAL